MRRRDVLSLLGGALAPWTCWAEAQQVDRMRVIGVLIGFSESDPSTALRIANFEQGLRELGWIKGRNIQIHYRLAAEQEVLQAHARDLMALQPDLIVAGSTMNGARAAPVGSFRSSQRSSRLTGKSSEGFEPVLTRST